MPNSIRLSKDWKPDLRKVKESCLIVDNANEGSHEFFRDRPLSDTPVDHKKETVGVVSQDDPGKTKQ